MISLSHFEHSYIDKKHQLAKPAIERKGMKQMEYLAEEKCGTLLKRKEKRKEKEEGIAQEKMPA